MIEEINQGIVIVLDTEVLNNQIHQQQLSAILGLKFKFANSYRNQALTEIAVEIKNQSLTQVIYVNWQYSTFSDVQGRSQRIIYQVPGLTLDLFTPQTFTVITSGQTLEAKIITENCLSRGEKNEALTIKNPIFDWKTLKKMKEEEQSFSLQLVFQISDPIYQAPQINLNTLKCQFSLREIPWQQVLYWAQK